MVVVACLKFNGFEKEENVGKVAVSFWGAEVLDEKPEFANSRTRV